MGGGGFLATTLWEQGYIYLCRQRWTEHHSLPPEGGGRPPPPLRRGWEYPRPIYFGIPEPSCENWPFKYLPLRCAHSHSLRKVLNLKKVFLLPTVCFLRCLKSDFWSSFPEPQPLVCESGCPVFCRRGFMMISVVQ